MNPTLITSATWTPSYWCFLTNVVNAAAVDRIPPADDDARHEVVLIFLAEPPHEMGGDLHGGGAPRLHCQLSQIVLDVVGEGLGVGGRPGAAAPDPFVDLGNFIRHAVGNVCACGNARVSPHDDAALERDRHDGRPRRHLVRAEVAGLGRFAVECGLYRMLSVLGVG